MATIVKDVTVLMLTHPTIGSEAYVFDTGFTAWSFLKTWIFIRMGEIPAFKDMTYSSAREWPKLLDDFNAISKESGAGWEATVVDTVYTTEVNL